METKNCVPFPSSEYDHWQITNFDLLFTMFVLGGQLNCDLCMVTCCTEDQLRIHIGGKKHQAKTRSNSESIFK